MFETSPSVKVDETASHLFTFRELALVVLLRITFLILLPD